MTDPYDHMREAFHIVADGLMEWEDPPERAESDSHALGAPYLGSLIPVIERAGERATRAHSMSDAVALFSLALRLRAAVRDGV
jgi:hypothetical protein